MDRLGRGLMQGSVEFQYWHRAHTLLDAGAALFTDVARTANRYAGAPQTDIDVGAGVRFAALGMSGTFRVDVARGLRDGTTILSAVYQP